MKSPPERESQVIQAAGGIVWKKTGKKNKKYKIAVIHRPAYDDWSLPKGKLADGESWAEAAIREVEEEIGCEVELGEFAGCSCYTVKEGAKVVLFWHMSLVSERPFEPNEEADRILWLSVPKAIKKLDYANERAVLK